MERFGKLYLDKEKDVIVELYKDGEDLSYVLRTPNHATGNLITNLASLCSLPLSQDEHGLKVIRGVIPRYVDDGNRSVYVFRLLGTKVANIYPDGTIERKASIPAISKTLMSQTKDYRLDFAKTVVKTYLLADRKFRTDLHTHMNANLDPDVLIALGVHHQIRYPLYYIKKLELRLTGAQKEKLEEQRRDVAARFADSPLEGKYLDRKVDDNTFLNFADLILSDPDNAAYNIPRIRASLAVMKDGQAVFTNLEKVYLYRYVFTKGVPSEETFRPEGIGCIPDEDVVRILRRMEEDRKDPRYADNTLFQDKLLWIARGYASRGIRYVEISDTTLVKKEGAAEMLRQAHEVLPLIEEETGVLIRFLAAIRRIPLTIVKDQIAPRDYLLENLQVLKAVSADPYVAGCDIVGEEINDIRDLKPVIGAIVRIAAEEPSFVIRIHAGENDSLRDNVANSIRCVADALQEGQKMPHMRIGHGLYTANLNTRKGRQTVREILDHDVVLEFQITSNVRLNNLSELSRHPIKQYLAAGIRCVQGTDGAALYGTDSIDEQLSLEKMLDLSGEELLSMRRTEDGILETSLREFEEKKRRFEEALDGREPFDYLTERIDEASVEAALPPGPASFDSNEALKERIRDLPEGKVPVIVAGGSFNSDNHRTRLHGQECRLIDRLLEEGDPEKMFFMIGHRLNGYEKYLLERNGGRFEVYAMVPSILTASQLRRLRESGANIRVSIEPSGMGLYKSFAYEVFKRRPSVLLALDGNSAGVNMIQEARNGRKKCRVYVSGRSRVLKAKAASLQGYVTWIGDPDAAASDVLSRIGGYLNEG